MRPPNHDDHQFRLGNWTRQIGPDTHEWRMSERQLGVLREALEAHARASRTALRQEEALHTRRIIARLPSLRPFDVAFSAADWPIISRALRCGTQVPKPGTLAMRARCLYALAKAKLPFAHETDPTHPLKGRKRRHTVD